MPRNHYTLDLETGEEMLVPFTAEEEAEADAREAETVASAAQRAKGDQARVDLLTKLQAGKASPDEVQAAVAYLLADR